MLVITIRILRIVTHLGGETKKNTAVGGKNGLLRNLGKEVIHSIRYNETPLSAQISRI